MVSILCITPLLIYPTFGLMAVQKLETSHVCCPVQDLQVRKARSSNTFLTTHFVTLSKLKFWCLRLTCIMEILSTLMRIRSSTGQCLVNSGDNKWAFLLQSKFSLKWASDMQRQKQLSLYFVRTYQCHQGGYFQGSGYRFLCTSQTAKGWGPSPSEDFVALGYSDPTELK